MAVITKLLDFVRATRRGVPQSDAKVDMGGGETVNALHFSIPNSDSRPLPNDYVLASHLRQTGRYASYGYHDPANAKQAQPGEHISYARKSDGAIVCRVWLKNTGEATLYNDAGSITLSPDGATTVVSENATFTVAQDGSIKGQNSAGQFELQAGGDFVVNGVTIDTDGNISTAGTVEADDVTATNQDVTLSTHNHGGPAPVPGT